MMNMMASLVVLKDLSADILEERNLFMALIAILTLHHLQ